MRFNTLLLAFVGLAAAGPAPGLCSLKMQSVSSSSQTTSSGTNTGSTQVQTVGALPPCSTVVTTTVTDTDYNALILVTTTVPGTVTAPSPIVVTVTSTTTATATVSNPALPVTTISSCASPAANEKRSMQTQEPRSPARKLAARCVTSTTTITSTVEGGTSTSVVTKTTPGSITVSTTSISTAITTTTVTKTVATSTRVAVSNFAVCNGPGQAYGSCWGVVSDHGTVPAGDQPVPPTVAVGSFYSEGFQFNILANGHFVLVYNPYNTSDNGRIAYQNPTNYFDADDVFLEFPADVAQNGPNSGPVSCSISANSDGTCPMSCVGPTGNTVIYNCELDWLLGAKVDPSVGCAAEGAYVVTY